MGSGPNKKVAKKNAAQNLLNMIEGKPKSDGTDEETKPAKAESKPRVAKTSKTSTTDKTTTSNTGKFSFYTTENNFPSKGQCSVESNGHLDLMSSLRRAVGLYWRLALSQHSGEYWGNSSLISDEIKIRICETQPKIKVLV